MIDHLLKHDWVFDDESCVNDSDNEEFSEKPDFKSVFDFESLPTDRKSEVKQRLNILKLIQDFGHGGVTREAYDFVVETKLYSVPSQTTVRGWWQRWVYSGFKVESLLPRYHLRGNRTSKVSPAVERMIADAIRSRYLTKKCHTVGVVYIKLLEMLEKENVGRSVEFQLQAPALSTLTRRIRALDPYVVAVARKGKAHADRLYKHVGMGVTSRFPLDVVQIDHTVLDVILTDENGTLLGRPTLTVAIDVYSRAVLGFHISFDAPGWKSVMRCLSMAIQPKDSIFKRYSSLRFGWPCHGIMLTVLLDNGPEFHGHAIEDAANGLSIELRYCPAKKPYYKGIVERYFGTANTKLVHRLPGTTFSNTKARGDYKSEKEACVTLPKLEEWFTRFVIEIYMPSLHMGILEAPLDRWGKGVKLTSIRLPDPSIPMAVLLGEIVFRSLTRRGIELYGLMFSSEELALGLRRRIAVLGKNKAKGKVKVKFDASDMGRVWVHAVPNEPPIYVPCIDQEASDGIPLWQVKAVRSRLLADAKIQQKGRRKSLVEGTAELQNDIQEYGETARRKKRTAKRLGRMKEGATIRAAADYSKLKPTNTLNDDNIFRENERVEATENITWEVGFLKGIKGAGE
ncbi:MAG: hypothetical protein CMK02_07130 [Polycyclovorans sp.]|nr:hypothetical protein [Rhodospirillaceae bacterium]MAX62757.1 hypothetical protein [Rhodospirillaceae bacterium]MAY26052.1 hypothetical protein [Polycyclovorans sp.]MBB57600.1 hypothetical protein [Rhodospirillaceae bacterium]HAE00484.1 hypothetical protein [Rhodospirillaceae bacterium]|tara:strand:- start:768 stop:2645 length:1878 start_codon:yes stop_codon:yes gene_type:complete